MVLCLIDKPVRTSSDLFSSNKQTLDKGAISLSKMNSPIKNVIDLLSDVCSQPQELSIDPVEGGLEKVSLSGILTVK